MTKACITPGASRTTSVVQMGGHACRFLRPARRESTVGKQRISQLTRLCSETFSTDTTTTPKRAPPDRSSRPHSGKHKLFVRWSIWDIVLPFVSQQGNRLAGLGPLAPIVVISKIKLFVTFL